MLAGHGSASRHVSHSLRLLPLLPSSVLAVPLLSSMPTVLYIPLRLDILLPPLYIGSDYSPAGESSCLRHTSRPHYSLVSRVAASDRLIERPDMLTELHNPLITSTSPDPTPTVRGTERSQPASQRFVQTDTVFKALFSCTSDFPPLDQAASSVKCRQALALTYVSTLDPTDVYTVIQCNLFRRRVWEISLTPSGSQMHRVRH